MNGNSNTALRKPGLRRATAQWRNQRQFTVILSYTKLRVRNSISVTNHASLLTHMRHSFLLIHFLRKLSPRKELKMWSSPLSERVRMWLLLQAALHLFPLCYCQGVWNVQAEFTRRIWNVQAEFTRRIWNRNDHIVVELIQQLQKRRSQGCLGKAFFSCVPEVYELLQGEWY
jgi:hypothetical protein